MAQKKARDYCCCAIPLVNAGIYTILVEQLVFGATAGTLAIATTSIVGASTPSFAKWIFAIVCYVAAALQLLGIIAVAQDKAITFRRFLTLHGMVVVALFAVSAAWVALSASHHSTAQSACLKSFFPTSSSLGITMCNIFPWVDVGIMGGMLVFFSLVHIYFYVVMSSYSNSQQRAHDDHVFGGETKSLTNDIPMNNRMETLPLHDPSFADGAHSGQRNIGDGYDHYRSNSGQSLSTVMAEPIQREHDQGSYLQRAPSTAYPETAYPAYPETLYTQEPGPTPVYHDDYYSEEHGNSDLNRPLPSQPHPAEGSFRRKAPRLQKQRQGNLDVYYQQ